MISFVNEIGHMGADLEAVCILECTSAGGNDADLALWLAVAIVGAVQPLGLYEVHAVVYVRRLKLHKVHLAWSTHEQGFQCCMHSRVTGDTLSQLNSLQHLPSLYSTTSIPDHWGIFRTS